MILFCEELIAQLESASSPSRKLDGMIFKAVFGKPQDRWELFEDDVWMRQYPEDRCAYDPPPHYTTSIDAAITLIPKGWDYCIRCDEAPGFANVHKLTAQNDGPRNVAYASSPALAVCAAALKARGT